MIEEELFEITTQIGCPVNCKKYCPQEVITGRYSGERILSLNTFKKILNMLPVSIPINFSGVCEPFINSESPDMILYAYNHGHRIIVFSTLVGLSPADAVRISTIPFEEFILHLPDANGNAKIPLTREYFLSLKTIMSTVNNLSFMNMREPFISNNAEKIARGICPPVHIGRVICFRHEVPNLNMMPNGDVYFCCICRGVSEKVGSVYEYTYEELVDRMKMMSKRMQSDPNSICHMCGYAQPWWRYQISKVRNHVLTAMCWRSG